MSLRVENDILVLRMKKKKKEKPLSVWVAQVGSKAKILVKKGQGVKVGQTLALKERKKTKKIPFPPWLKKGLGTWAKGAKKVVGEEVELKEVIYQGVGFPKKKLIWESVVEGKISGLNEEEGYLEVLVSKEEEKLISPVVGTVIKAAKGEVQISFLAQELLGEGLGEGVGWGRLGAMEGDLFASLSADHQGQILLVEEVSGPLVEKGRALGVAGFIAFGKEPELIKSSLPVLIFSREKGKKTESDFTDLVGHYCFVSPAHNQILICLEKEELEE